MIMKKKFTKICIILILFSILISSNTILAYNDDIGSELVLLTGFEPFDIYDVNPSQIIAEELNGKIIEGVEVIGVVLPVNFEKSLINLTCAIEDYNPTIIISMGL